MQSSSYCEQHCHGCMSCSRSCSGSDSCPYAHSRALALVLTLSLSAPLVLSLALALALALTPLSRCNLHTLPRCCPCCRSGSHSRSRNLSRSRSRSRSSWFLAVALARSVSPLLWFMTFASDGSTSRLTDTLPTNMCVCVLLCFVDPILGKSRSRCQFLNQGTCHRRPSSCLYPLRQKLLLILHGGWDYINIVRWQTQTWRDT